MIRFFFRLALLAFVLTDLSLSAEAIFFPQNCWNKEPTCAVQNDSKQAMALKLDGLTVHMDSQAILRTRSENEADLARGTLFAQHEKDFTWSTPFGKVICGGCEVLLQRDESSLEVSAIKGLVRIVRKGDDNSYELPPGFSVQLSRVSNDGKANLDFPQASALVLVGKQWAKIHTGSNAEFKQAFKDYVQTWEHAATLSSEMQKQNAEREIAADEAFRAKEEELRRARQKEQDRIRALFRSKNYL